MLIDKSYFVLEINIPTGSVPVLDRLNGFIEQYEIEFLHKVLGYPLADQFIAGYAAVPPAQKWVNLATGTTYTLNGKTIKWNGLLMTTPKRSPIANYIYYWYSRDAHTKTSTMGETKAKVENSEPITPAWKMVAAWAKMQLWINDLFNFLEAHKDTYGFTRTKYDIQCEFGNINEFNI
jgi:hypothetical protein